MLLYFFLFDDHDCRNGAANHHYHGSNDTDHDPNRSGCAVFYVHIFPEAAHGAAMEGTIAAADQITEAVLAGGGNALA
jgi:hypothetical protein